MLKLKTKHFLTGEELSVTEYEQVLSLSSQLKAERKQGGKAAIRENCKGKTLALLFEKPSLRTRFSFTVAMQELSGFVVEINSNLRKKEEPEDTVQVIGRYAHGIMYRTFDHDIFDRMISKSSVPIINGLSDTHHPCQTLADLLTLKEKFGFLKGLKVSYLGDGNNTLHSLLLMAPFLGIDLSYACPNGFEPNSFIVKKAQARAKEGLGGKILACSTPEEAVRGANALYTDVWTSMGFETSTEEQADRESAFDGYQINEDLYALTSHQPQEALIMHCMPMLRGREIAESMADHKNSVIFDQAENRLHVQKALLLCLMGDHHS